MKHNAEKGGPAINQAIKQAAKEAGLPECMILDNGRAFASNTVRQVAQAHGVHVVYGSPYETPDAPEGNQQ